MTTPHNHPDLPEPPAEAVAAEPKTAGSQSTESQNAAVPSPAPRRQNRLAIGAAVLALTGVLGGVASVATADQRSSASAEATAEQQGETPRKATADTNADGGTDLSDLGSVTLDELAEELADLGLEITIDPATDADGDWNEGDWNEGDWNEEGQQDDQWDDEAYVDPFEGMTDAEIDQLSDDEFIELLEAAGDEDWEDEDWDDEDRDGHDHGDDEAPAASFPVDGDRLDTSGVSPELAEQATKIWNRFITLIPADQRQMVSGFELMPADYDGAHVYPSDEDPTKWVLGMGADLGEDLDYILIHEFGHLLTLQAKEVPPSPDGESCATYYTGEGCALTGSTVASFVQKFWPQEMLDQIEELYENEDYDGLDAFYEQNKDRFVTDYAASNPGEDLAETFTHFVLEDRPTGNTIADQKVQLLWADPDLVELRDQIRANL